MVNESIDVFSMLLPGKFSGNVAKLVEVLLEHLNSENLEKSIEEYGLCRLRQALLSNYMY